MWILQWTQGGKINLWAIKRMSSIQVMLQQRTKTHNSPISQLLVCFNDEMGKTATKMNYFVCLSEFDQEKLKNCEVGLISARLNVANCT